MDADVIVEGRASAAVVADRATLHVRVRAESATRDDALARAAAVAAAVDAALAARGEAVARAVGAVLSVHPRTRWHDGEEQQTGWAAARDTRVEVTGLDELGTLVGELVAAGAEVHGPSWTVDPTNPVHAEVRRAAAVDARERAVTYATALGYELGLLVWISEPGLRSPRPAAPEIGFARMAAPAAAGGGSPEVELVPAELTVSASVEVGFSLVRGAG
ncbi:MAG: SIMPL domain-containing protein [Acidimicrobiia bacterium]